MAKISYPHPHLAFGDVLRKIWPSAMSCENNRANGLLFLDHCL